MITFRGIWHAGVQASHLDGSCNTGENTRNGKHLELGADGADAGSKCSFRIAADSIDITAETGAAENNTGDNSDSQKENDG